MTVPGPYLPPDKVYEEATPQVRLAAQRAGGPHGGPHAATESAFADRTSRSSSRATSRSRATDPGQSWSSSGDEGDSLDQQDRDADGGRASGASRRRRERELEELCCEFLLRHRIDPQLLCAYRQRRGRPAGWAAGQPGAGGQRGKGE
ncbi:hypothetical protein ONE63_006125 [Megalurothrips usitatus]|uniref:Uncharacterized protein n=1 Tax=Megalurothrips usitatus TaxID=439358 RepID=A0AAV7XZC4_9NEOP|nr:hypothetical protein ONE63_006125 [Megalurothrips usitatus]